MPQQMTEMRKEKKGFSADFLLLFKTVPRRNITIMMGDFNAKIGSDNRGYEQIMGQHGFGSDQQQS